MYWHGVWVALGPAVHRKIQRLWLYIDFAKNNSAKKLLEKVLALQSIPAGHITLVLTDLGPKSECGSFEELCEYIEMLLCQRWSPDDWTQFYRVGCTNNEVKAGTTR